MESGVLHACRTGADSSADQGKLVTTTPSDATQKSFTHHNGILTSA
jgi:hypothetical protein